MALWRLVLVDVAPTWHVAHMALTSMEKKGTILFLPLLLSSILILPLFFRDFDFALTFFKPSRRLPLFLSEVCGPRVLSLRSRKKKGTNNFSIRWWTFIPLLSHNQTMPSPFSLPQSLSQTYSGEQMVARVEQARRRRLDEGTRRRWGVV